MSENMKLTDEVMEDVTGGTNERLNGDEFEVGERVIWRGTQHGSNPKTGPVINKKRDPRVSEEITDWRQWLYDVEWEDNPIWGPSEVDENLSAVMLIRA